MLATSSQFTAMVEGVTHDYAWRIEIDLPGGIYPDVTVAASAIEVDASITTDMAEGTRLEEGYASQQASFTLSGPVSASDPSKDAAWLFGRYSTTSPLYRTDVFMCPVRVFLGLLPSGAGGVPEMLRKFTGFVEDYTQDTDGNVTFTCLDGRQMLRSAASTPNVITIPPYNAGLTSEFAVDALLRSATAGAVSSWPKRRASCLLAAGLRSSLWAEVGSLVGTTAGINTVSPSFATGPTGSVLTGKAGAGYEVYYNAAAPLAGSQDLFVEFFASASAPGDQVYLALNDSAFNTSGDYSVSVSYQQGLIFVSTSNSTGAASLSFTVPTDSAWHYVAVRTHWPVGSTALTVTLFFDGTTTTKTGTTGTRTATTAKYLTVGVIAGIGAYGLQVTSEAAPASNYGFTPGAILDPSLNPLILVPDLTGDPWQIIQQIAAAELAIARFDESTGQFRFQNRNTLAATPVGRTISALTSLETIGGVESTAASVVNRAQVGYTGWTFATTATTVYSLDTVTRIPQHSSVPITVTLDSPVVNLDTTLSTLPDGTVDPTQSWVRASRDVNGLNSHPGGLSFKVTQTQADQVTVTVTNSSNVDGWLVSPASYADVPAGTPLLELAGIVVTQSNEVITDYQWPTPELGGAVSSRFGEVLFNSTGNPWSQVPTGLAQMIVEESYQPRPNFTGLAIVPDPRIQIGDKALVDDTARTGVQEYVRIFGYTITWSAGEESDTYEMTVDGRTLANPGQWLLGISGRSELATTTYL